MNLIDLIHDAFDAEGKTPYTPASLFENIHFMGIARGRECPFHQKEDSATRVFFAKVLAMFYDRSQGVCDVKDPHEIETHISSLSPNTLLTIIDDISVCVFNPDGLEPLPPARDQPDTRDLLFTQHARFIDMMIVYLTLKHAIKNGDIGLLTRCFARTAVILNGSKKKKYAYLSLYLEWLTRTQATSEPLKKAILGNGLVNITGKGDSWFEIDRFNEFLNLKLKLKMRARRTSTESLDDLFH